MSSNNHSDSLPPLRIAAASDLALALPELVERFQQQHDQEISLTLGSSGLLARQIANGAPFDLYFSAHVDFVDDLLAQGHARADSRAIYALGRIVLWTRAQHQAAPKQFSDLRQEHFRRIALANPEHAPYGVAGKQALQQAGLWAELQPRVVFAENIAQAQQFVQSGNAEIGIIALALAMHRPGGAWLLLDESRHEPLEQGLAITQQARQPQVAQDFIDLVMGEEGQAILQRHGFVLPGHDLAPGLIEQAGGRKEP